MLLGPGTFDAATGELRLLDGFALAGPRLDVWRAPTDNDLGAPWQSEPRHGLLWREAGLHRMRHRVPRWSGGAGAVGARPSSLTPGRCPAAGRAAARRR